MAEYGKVYKQLWRLDRFRTLSDDGRQAVLYALTNPHSNTIGIYRLSLLYASDDLGWSSKRTARALKEAQIQGFIKHDEKHSVMLVYNWWGDGSESKRWN